MINAIKKWWKQHKQDVEDWKREDILKKKATIRMYVMRWYEAKHKAEGNELPYWIEANKELEKHIKTDADVLFYYSKIKQYIKNI